jgi:CheY-like chemotaxis protein
MALILVIDDENDILNLIETVLVSKGHDVVKANDGREGMDLLRSENPDLVITDILMPVMSG